MKIRLLEKKYGNVFAKFNNEYLHKRSKQFFIGIVISIYRRFFAIQKSETFQVKQPEIIQKGVVMQYIEP